MRVTGKTRLAGIMGWPVSHSRSPALHNFWIEETGIDAVYVPFPVKPERLETALRALPMLGVRGCNLTLPHKQMALSIVDRVDPLARRVGAMNTVIVAEDGSLEGRNTDVYGFTANLRESVPDWDPRHSPAVVLGAGGASRAVLVGLAEMKVSEVRLVNRSQARAKAVAEELQTATTRITVHEWEQRDRALADAGLLVNTTSLGMTGEPDLDMQLEALPKSAVVNDIVYAPLETTLLAQARQRGHRVVDGLGMLLHQGRPCFEAWFATPVSVSRQLRAAVLMTLSSR